MRSSLGASVIRDLEPLTVKRGRGRAWILGAGIGAVGVLLIALTGTLALVAIAAVTFGAMTTATRWQILAGALTGLGATSLVLLAVHPVSCVGCEQPNLTGWVLAAVLLLVAGVGGSVWQIRQE